MGCPFVRIKGMNVEPLHPIDVYEVKWALVFLMVLCMIIMAQILGGTWDKFLEFAVEWFPIWRWGGLSWSLSLDSRFCIILDALLEAEWRGKISDFSLSRIYVWISGGSVQNHV